ncbi:hypothetical protein STEG23_013590 [Scotinomys teguina]
MNPLNRDDPIRSEPDGSQNPNLKGQTIREKRIVEAANRKELDYEAGDIPTEWEGIEPRALDMQAWIRRTRKTPPTMEPIESFYPCPYVRRHRANHLYKKLASGNILKRE